MKHHLSCLWDIDSNTIFFFWRSRYICVQSSTKQFPSSKRQKKLGNGEKNYKSFNDSESVFSLGSSNEKKEKLYLFFIQKGNKPICP